MKWLLKPLLVLVSATFVTFCWAKELGSNYSNYESIEFFSISHLCWHQKHSSFAVPAQSSSAALQNSVLAVTQGWKRMVPTHEKTIGTHWNAVQPASNSWFLRCVSGDGCDMMWYCVMSMLFFFVNLWCSQFFGYSHGIRGWGLKCFTPVCRPSRGLKNHPMCGP